MVRVRHECKSTLIGKINKNLTEVQKCRIEGTPFKWLMWLPEKTKICGKLLEELVQRWDERRGGFVIQGRAIRFTPLDVCLTLGLRILGKEVDFKVDPESSTKKLFDEIVINKQMVYAKLNNLRRDEDVEDFARLYILLGLEEFYFPNSSPTLQSWYFKYLDDLQSIGKYNWGVAVYKTLSKSLNEGIQKVRNGKNSAQLHIKGCVVVLQVWALEHVMFYKNTTTIPMSFPRIFKVQDISIKDKDIPDSLDNNRAIEVLSATKEDLKDAVVKEALNWKPTGYFKWNEDFALRATVMNNTQLLIAENQELEAKISQLEVELRELKPLDSQFDVSMEDADFVIEREITNLSINEVGQEMKPLDSQFELSMEDVDFVIEREISNHSHNEVGEASNLYTQRQQNPRKREESAVTQTPFMKLLPCKRKRKAKNKDV